MSAHTHCSCPYCENERQTRRKCDCAACTACDACKELAERRRVVNEANTNKVRATEKFWLVIRIGHVTGTAIRQLDASFRHTSFDTAYQEMIRLTAKEGGTFAVFELTSAATSYNAVGISPVEEPLPF